ncbi:MAG TPA: phage baseplate assembly protein V [Chloroflexaceae bacterium]|nr:phage baseplate assembly protein V [Chloroflexaceae bacterium]
MIPTRTDDILARLVERVEGRYFGKYRGEVTDNADPDNLGRIRARVPRLLGEEVTGWALPAFAYGGAAEQGLFAVPDVGAHVWVEFEGGDLSYPIWSGVWYASGELPEGATPAVKVLKTKSGHKIVMDDDGGTLEIADSNGNSIKLDSNGIVITNGSKTIKLSSSSVSINDGALEVL